jgi:leucyl aminopeptidase
MVKSISRAPVKFSGKQDVVVLPMFDDARELRGPAKKLDVLCRSGISGYVKKSGFSAKLGDSALIGFPFPKAPGHVLLLGLGQRESASPERLAGAGGSASKAVKSRGFRSCHLIVDALYGFEGADDGLRAFLKGFLLAQYEFSVKSAEPARDRQRCLNRLVILSDDAKRISAAIRSSRTIAEYTAYARDLVNRPADDLTPARMAEEAQSLARSEGFECRAMGPKEIAKLRMGAVLGVARGSEHEPRFIVLHYNKGAAGRLGIPKVCLVGKGVTFDSGGLSIKSWQNMHEMKGDMAGGAAVMGAMGAAARLGVTAEIIGLIPCVENMPDGTSFRPGDVIVTHSGKTIEVISTDAEGRLILADALAYSHKFDPDLILDVATLTGSVIIALGTRIAGAIGNNQEYIDQLIAAGRSVAEPVWQLPIDETFIDSIKGDISDYKNFAGREGSSITAAALLAEFVGKTPWIHLDIAGTAWTQEAKPAYRTKGATGYGVDLLVRFLQSIAAVKRRDGD